MAKKFYTNERNVQIVIALLKAHGIRKVIASPGTTNMTFVGSIQIDPYFQIYSCVDERSAAYMACGISAECNEPVVLSCTGATASRNYMPGLTEAFYRKLPILAITSHRGDHQIGHLKDQQIDRRERPKDIVIESVTIPNIKDKVDEDFCIIEANKAILALKANGGGPVHINMFTTYSKDFTIKDLPPVRKICRYTVHDKLPTLQNGRIAIFCGAHANFTDKQSKAIDAFCSSNNAVVFADHTSGYRGQYEINWALVLGQRNYPTELKNIDTMIQIGEIPGSTYHKFNIKQSWRVSEDGVIRDMFGKLTAVFQMPEEVFFTYYTKTRKGNNTYYIRCKTEYDKVISKIQDLPFGNIWIAKRFSNQMPIGCEIHFGILNCLRSWSFFQLPKDVLGKCNVGGYGIDGGLSSLIGASITNPNKLFFGIFGDLAFFYDLNVLGNRHIGRNVRIMIINNGKGAEFRNYGHPCYSYGEEADTYMAAAGHFGNKSPNLIKHYAKDLGFDYYSGKTKEDIINIEKTFLNAQITNKPIILEVFTESKNESDALEYILNLFTPPLKRQIKHKIKSTYKQILNTIKEKQ
ncbi:MAG: 2-succinyl-5-enolpyruvyl-6-hydroxy-3-cyclohexene-1-carboxylate synthase [Clostridia bacterium]|nr:2-succinyl-5-enolpyruvyl-6-hydroxy-3-cyclohexene-1-carboxylate synthase [Clostridia bacterium]